MDTKKVIDNNIRDLNIAISMANTANNKSLKDYVTDRLSILSGNRKLYEFASINNVVDSYIIDLELFINVSNIIKDIDSKDYYKSRVIELIKNFSYLSTRSDLIDLL